MPDAVDVALGNAVVFQLLDQTLDDIIEAWAEPSAGHNSSLAVPGIEEHLLTGSCPHGPGRKRHANLQHDVSSIT